MLPSYDLSLVQRDRGLPGLELLLDAEAFTASLSAVLPWQPSRNLSIRYLRYKPGRRCIAMYEAGQEDGQERFVAIAHDQDSWRKHCQTYDDGTSDTHPRSRDEFAKRMISVVKFPRDRKLRFLHEMQSPETARDLIRRFTGSENCQHLECVAYKPGRRAVFAVTMSSGEKYAIKMFQRKSLSAAADRSRAWEEQRAALMRSGVVLPELVRVDSKRGVLVSRWVPGDSLGDQIRQSSTVHATLSGTGQLLWQLHRSRPDLRHHAWHPTPNSWSRYADHIGFLDPTAGVLANHCAARIANGVVNQSGPMSPIHGDFYAKQICVGDATQGVFDFDQSTYGDPFCDLGNFIGKLYWNAIQGEIDLGEIDALQNAFLSGYGLGDADHQDSLEFWTAAGIFKCATHPFRTGMSDWPKAMHTLLNWVDQKLDSADSALPSARSHPSKSRTDVVRNKPPGLAKRLIRDLPASNLASILHPHQAAAVLVDAIAEFKGKPVEVLRVTPQSYKSGRRCVIRFDLCIPQSQTLDQYRSIVGKMRFKGVDRHGYEVQRQLYQNGFDGKRFSGVSVPRTLGISDRYRTWFQEYVDGVALQTLCQQGEVGQLFEAQREISRALNLIHQEQIARPLRQHTVVDEMKFLSDRLKETAEHSPELSREIKHVIDLAGLVAPRLSTSPIVPIHRDFHPAQVVVAAGRLYLLDFDLYCRGPQLLDAGNYLAHLAELAIRYPDQSQRWETAADHFTRHYVKTSKHIHEQMDSLKAWTWIALARHIWISRRLQDRHWTTRDVIAEVGQQGMRIAGETCTCPSSK